MSDNRGDDGFADGFLEDFFGESEEHLAAIRRNLLALETALASGTASPATLDDLFRSFHSLKGIAGMVQLAKAEVVAHDMESYLRSLRQGDAAVTAAGVEALIAGTGVLNAIIAARRTGEQGPDIEPIRRRLASLVVAGSAARQPADAVAQAVAQKTPDDSHPGSPLNTWRVTFVPSNELLARGINVNVMRQRLGGLGTIRDARPKLTESGGIAFEFIVSTPADADTLEPWRGEGVSYERVAPGEPAEKVAATTVPADVPSGLAASVASAVSRTVRVDVERLDEVMRIVADIVVTRTRLDEALERVEDRLPHTDWRPLQEANQALERHLRVLRESVMRVRLVPVREIFGKMPFVVRDLARDLDKQVRLDLRGQETEIDKFVIERMMDPILHLVRNAITHGAEPAKERVARSKPPVATVGLRAATVGDTVVIEVEDDGRGIDRDAVIGRARELGMHLPEAPDNAVLLEALCAPGFSTREEADRAAGRGVGMAVVKRTLEQLSGTIEMDTEPGRGTRFVMTLPLTLAIIDAMICRVGPHRFAVPQAAVREVLEVDPAAVRAMEHNELFPYRQSVLPLVHVADVLGLERPATRTRIHVFVVGTGLQAVGLGVDRIVGQREIVVRAITDPLLRIPGLAGATELGDGRPILILDPLVLVKLARRAAVPG